MPRWFHNLRAFFGGYFWMPCPVCRRMYGGHEEHFGVWDPEHPTRGFSVCSQKCQRDYDGKTHEEKMTIVRERSDWIASQN